MAKFIKLHVNVPLDYCDKVREAMGKAGAGKIGNYEFCSFSIKGTGRCLPLVGASPAIGTIGNVELIEEEKIETFCEEALLQNVIQAIKSAHPYEEPAISFFPVEIV